MKTSNAVIWLGLGYLALKYFQNQKGRPSWVNDIWYGKGTTGPTASSQTDTPFTPVRVDSPAQANQGQDVPVNNHPHTCEMNY